MTSYAMDIRAPVVDSVRNSTPPRYSLVNKDEYMLINTPVQSVITFNSLGRRFRFVYIYACMCFCVATVFSMNKDLYNKECHHFLTVL